MVSDAEYSDWQEQQQNCDCTMAALASSTSRHILQGLADQVADMHTQAQCKMAEHCYATYLSTLWACSATRQKQYLIFMTIKQQP